MVIAKSDEIRELVGSNKLEEAVEILTEFAQESQIQNLIDLSTLIAARYSKFSELKIQRTESSEWYDLEYSRIIVAIQSLVGRIEKEKEIEKPVSNKSTVRIDLKVEGDFRTLTQDQKEEILQNIALILGTGVSEIKGIRAGSIILSFELDDELVKTLEELLEKGQLKNFGILELNKVFKKLDKEVVFYADMKGANLQKANLQEAKLGNANLNRADLTGADLTGADLGYANLRKANLKGANLGAAFLAGANLQEVYLVGADLQGAYLVGADLREANIEGAFLIRADLRKAYLVGANFRGANLAGTNLAGANLARANFSNTFFYESQESILIELGIDTNIVKFLPGPGGTLEETFGPTL